MDGFTPQFVLEVLIAVGSAGGVYGAIRTDLKNQREGIAEEKRLREKLAKDTDESIHDVRSDIEGVSGRVYVIEGRLGRAP
jgi:hypothetical protein